MSNRTIVELNHDYCPRDNALELIEWALRMAASGASHQKQRHARLSSLGPRTCRAAHCRGQGAAMTAALTHLAAFVAGALAVYVAWFRRDVRDLKRSQKER